MRLPLILLSLVAAAIVAAWWWLGRPVAMPQTLLAAGDRLPCVSYAPFRPGQSPLDPSTMIDPRQIEEDLAQLARLTQCVRTYSTRNGLDRVIDIAGRFGVRVMQGIWIGGEAGAMRQDIARAVELARAHKDVVAAVIVGNEVLLRGDMPAPELIATIRSVKAQVPVPVTYADVWEFWLRHRAIAEAVDFVTVHILPYWEDIPIPARAAAAHVDSIRARVAAEFPGKDVLIGEVGWPSQGRMREGALPSPANQALVVQEVLARARQGSYRVNVIEAYDQPWKRQLEGTVGGHWGLIDAYDRQPKFAWGVPVSNHPRWVLQAAAGLALALMCFGAAFAADRRGHGRSRIASGTWTGVALIALAGGIPFGWTLADVPVQSLGIGGWTRSLTLAALALAVPPLAAAALVRGLRVPVLARVFGAAAERPATRLALLLGVLLALTALVAVENALGLVFDARYRDLPFAPLTAAVVPFLVLSLASLPRDGARVVAETAFGALLAASALYIVINESLANWQAVWLSLVLLALAAVLLRARDAPG